MSRDTSINLHLQKFVKFGVDPGTGHVQHTDKEQCH